eukprot:CAMPEP_0118990510 /NCGR_PEP_ID=MMETSP1173-20130426/50074_1 /TAXON_ID=1034831 /ORGANISM="Rhizochromulina marina cf, Strain CCMP1243" /LENGTH=69 /DNA_ID=CAMNT_0006941567 /DNA_START=15 /DNA_END=225 /DNA_ORIENTATION=+
MSMVHSRRCGQGMSPPEWEDAAAELAAEAEHWSAIRQGSRRLDLHRAEPPRRDSCGIAPVELKELKVPR